MPPPFARSAYEIHSPRLTIRTPTESDTETYLKLLTTPENFPHQPVEQDLTIEKLRARIGRFATSSAAGTNAFLVFVLRETGELVGHGGYNTFELVDPRTFLAGAPAPGDAGGGICMRRMTDVGLMVDHRHWRLGLGVELLCALVEYARDELGCEIFRTETADDNEPWRALMRAVGLGDVEARGMASYDESQEAWIWRFDAAHWRVCKEKMQATGRWPL